MEIELLYKLFYGLRRGDGSILHDCAMIREFFEDAMPEPTDDLQRGDGRHYFGGKNVWTIVCGGNNKSRGLGWPKRYMLFLKRFSFGTGGGHSRTEYLSSFVVVRLKLY